jgi:hypothetical protein
MLVNNARYQEAAAIQRQAIRIAERLGDRISRAYAFYGEIALSTITRFIELRLGRSGG